MHELERKRVEEALADMASFPEMNPAPVLRLDRHGTILLVNPAARELLGEPNLLGKSWYALCLELEPNALERVLRGNDTLQCETEVRERCLLFTHRAGPDRGQVYVYGADITERKRAEEALADMASFAEMNPAPVLRLDREGTILLVNPAARELLGEPSLLGKSWYALCPELEPNALERVLRGNDTLQCETEMGERCLLFTHCAGPDRGRVYVYGADITERKRAEEALRESEERYHNIFDYSNDAIFIIDPAQDQIVDANPKACSMLGYSRGELLSVPVSSIHPNERRLGSLRALRRVGLARAVLAGSGNWKLGAGLRLALLSGPGNHDQSAWCCYCTRNRTGAARASFRHGLANGPQRRP